MRARTETLAAECTTKTFCFKFLPSVVGLLRVTIIMGIATKLSVVVALVGLILGLQEWRVQRDAVRGDCARLRLGEEEPAWEPEASGSRTRQSGAANIHARTVQLRSSYPSLLRTMINLTEMRARGQLDDPEPRGLRKRVQHPLSWGCVLRNATLTVAPGVRGAVSW